MAYEGRRRMWILLHRALRGKCPCCGRAPLFQSYLQQVDVCSVCGETWSEIRADDGPTWLTMFVVLHLLAPILLITAKIENLPTWMLITGISAFAILMCLLILPRAKGIFIAVIWATRPRAQKDSPRL